MTAPERRDWDADRRRAGCDRLGGGVLAEPAASASESSVSSNSSSITQRRVGRPQPDHPPVLPSARLRPACQARLRDAGRRSRREAGRTDRDASPAASTCGRPTRRSRRSTTPRAWRPRASRSSASTRPRSAGAGPNGGFADEVTGLWQAAGRARRPVPGQCRPPPPRPGARGDAPRRTPGSPRSATRAAATSRS